MALESSGLKLQVFFLIFKKNFSTGHSHEMIDQYLGKVIIYLSIDSVCDEGIQASVPNQGDALTSPSPLHWSLSPESKHSEVERESSSIILRLKRCRCLESSSLITHQSIGDLHPSYTSAVLTSPAHQDQLKVNPLCLEHHWGTCCCFKRELQVVCMLWAAPVFARLVREKGLLWRRWRTEQQRGYLTFLLLVLSCSKWTSVLASLFYNYQK